MAKSSLASIKSQIEKLQKQADSIQNTVISRIKKEIAQHGLTAEDLFGNGIRSVGNGKPAQPKKAAKSGGSKVVKFADGQGNTWGGIGKRPDWIRAALEAGRALEEFLVGHAAKPAAAPKASAKRTKKAAPVKKAAVKKAAAKKAKPAAKAPAKKAPKAAAAAKPPRKVAAKKAPAKKAASKKAPKAAAPSAAEAPAAQA